jgi:myosin heavy subunit
MDRPKPGLVEDLATLAKLDEQVLMEELKIRYRNNDIYVSVRHASSILSYRIVRGL